MWPACAFVKVAWAAPVEKSISVSLLGTCVYSELHVHARAPAASARGIAWQRRQRPRRMRIPAAADARGMRPDMALAAPAAAGMHPGGRGCYWEYVMNVLGLAPVVTRMR